MPKKEKEWTHVRVNKMTIDLLKQIKDKYGVSFYKTIELAILDYDLKLKKGK